MKSKIQEFKTNSYLGASKKAISVLGLALVAATNVALASNVGTSTSSNVAIVKYDVKPLFVAISKGDVATVKKFVEYGVDVNETVNGMTPLMFAVRYNNPEIAKFLIEKGADITLKNNNGYTALRLAEESKSNAVAEIIKAASTKK
ncbi:ankyrin repeat domain-containing protein [Flavobacterium enshiense]|uniref:ankyrin repeat domain-containing protein n=1 Tax=Flavobacterium enshiense TaxID=1341165 RepID=UPI00345DE934